jgi:hypothetical protein
MSEAAPRFRDAAFFDGPSGVAVQFAQVCVIITVLLSRFGWTLLGLAEGLADAGLPGHLHWAIGAIPRGGRLARSRAAEIGRARQAAAISVRAKSSPLNSRVSPRAFARA